MLLGEWLHENAWSIPDRHAQADLSAAHRQRCGDEVTRSRSTEKPALFDLAEQPLKFALLLSLSGSNPRQKHWKTVIIWSGMFLSGFVTWTSQHARCSKPERPESWGCAIGLLRLQGTNDDALPEFAWWKPSERHQLFGGITAAPDYRLGESTWRAQDFWTEIMQRFWIRWESMAAQFSIQGSRTPPSERIPLVNLKRW